MKVLTADKAGMCFGVKRALDLVRAALRQESAGVYVVGQLVHNRQVSDWLAGLGVREITEQELIAHQDRGSLYIIPSHGKGPAIYDIINAKACAAIDATCPLVLRVREKARRAIEDGYQVLIYGDPAHDEVKGHLAWLGAGCRAADTAWDAESAIDASTAAKAVNAIQKPDACQGTDTDSKTGVVRTAREGETSPRRLALLAQTTASADGFARLAARLESRGHELLVADTLCGASRERREAAGRLAVQVDLMLVIGGKNSANTGHLWEHCRKLAPAAYWIETKADIAPDWLRGAGIVGITAGASTPEWIIEEVVEMMEEFMGQDQEQVQVQEQPGEQMADAQTPDAAPAEETAQALTETETTAPETASEDVQTQAVPEEDQEEAEATFSDLEAEMGCLEFHPGDVVKGTVVKVASDEVLVDIGYKSEGIVPAFELAFTKVDPHSVVKVGDVINVEVVKEDRDGNYILSRKNALFSERISALEEAFERGEPVTATVIDVVKGGLLVDVGMRGFVPASHVERGFVKDLSEYLKKTLDFLILELNRAGRKVILSRKALLEREHQKVREAFWSNIEEGQIRKGIVKRLTDFGAFVDVGGCDGLLHVSEMGWGKVGRPSDVVAINDEIEVFVLKVDREKEKVSLSLKKLIPNPWELASEKYQVGGIYTGKVMRGASFGVFIQLEPSLEGLAHISQLAHFRVNKVDEVLTEGMIVPVKVLDIDLEKKRISLSVKEAIDLPRLVKDEPAEAPIPEAGAESETVEAAGPDETAPTGDAATAEDTAAGTADTEDVAAE